MVTLGMCKTECCLLGFPLGINRSMPSATSQILKFSQFIFTKEESNEAEEKGNKNKSKTKSKKKEKKK